MQAERAVDSDRKFLGRVRETANGFVVETAGSSGLDDFRQPDAAAVLIATRTAAEAPS